MEYSEVYKATVVDSQAYERDCRVHKLLTTHSGHYDSILGQWKVNEWN